MLVEIEPLDPTEAGQLPEPASPVPIEPRDRQRDDRLRCDSDELQLTIGGTHTEQGGHYDGINKVTIRSIPREIALTVEQDDAVVLDAVYDVQPEVVGSCETCTFWVTSIGWPIVDATCEAVCAYATDSGCATTPTCVADCEQDLIDCPGSMSHVLRCHASNPMQCDPSEDQGIGMGECEQEHAVMNRCGHDAF